MTKPNAEIVHSSAYGSAFTEVVFNMSAGNGTTPDSILEDTKARKACGALASRIAAAAVLTWKEINATGEEMPVEAKPERVVASKKPNYHDYTPSFQNGEDV